MLRNMRVYMVCLFIYFFLDFINTEKYEIIPAKNRIPQIRAGYTSSRFPSYFCIFP
jgi:hypothetical protein